MGPYAGPFPKCLQELELGRAEAGTGNSTKVSIQVTTTQVLESSLLPHRACIGLKLESRTITE